MRHGRGPARFVPKRRRPHASHFRLRAGIFKRNSGKRPLGILRASIADALPPACSCRARPDGTDRQRARRPGRRRDMRRKRLRLGRATLILGLLSEGSGSGTSATGSTSFLTCRRPCREGSACRHRGWSDRLQRPPRLGLLLCLGDLLLHLLGIVRPVIARGRHGDAGARLRQSLGIGRKQQRGRSAMRISLLTVAGDPHVVEDLALEFDAATTAKGKRGRARLRRGRRPGQSEIWLRCAPTLPSTSGNPGICLHLRRVSDLFVTPEQGVI